jgi:hypothetical protein
MKRQVLSGLRGVSPLGFFASLGLLQLCQQRAALARLGFLSDGSFRAFIEGFDGDLVELVLADAALAREHHDWLLEYPKEEKNGVKQVADLKAPPSKFREFLAATIAQWKQGRNEGAQYAAAFGTSEARDGKGNTKPTAFHFTAANQQFLGTVLGIRDMVNAERVHKSIFDGHAAEPGSNLRWDPGAERNWALMAENPVSEGTQVDAPLEWLAFRGLPFFPCHPQGKRIHTTAVHGRGDDMTLSWPLWSVPASLATARSALQTDWSVNDDRAARGIFAVCSSSIRRTSQGFGNFGPASVSS